MFDWNLARNILSLCEYTYRLGVLHGSTTSDPQECTEIASRQDGYTTYQFLGEERFTNDLMKDLRMYMDQIVVFCGRISAPYLRNFLVYSKHNQLKKDICSVIDYHYRKGIIHGMKLNDRVKARAFFEDIKLGVSHKHLFGKSSYNSMQYADKVKSRINRMHFARQEANIKSGFYLLSCKLGQAMVQKKMQQIDKKKYGNRRSSLH